MKIILRREVLKTRTAMDTILIVIILLVLFGGGGGLYWGMGAGWGIAPIGLIIAVLVVAFLLNGRRGRSSL
jgi:fatty acid desaturase